MKNEYGKINIGIYFSKKFPDSVMLDLIARFIQTDKLPEKISNLFKILDENVKVDIKYVKPNK